MKHQTIACSIILLALERLMSQRDGKDHGWQTSRGIDPGSNKRAYKRSYDEKPELLERPSSHEESGAETPHRIDGRIGDRNPNEMDRCQDQTDGDAREPNRSGDVCRA